MTLFCDFILKVSEIIMDISIFIYFYYRNCSFSFQRLLYSSSSVKALFKIKQRIYLYIFWLYARNIWRLLLWIKQYIRKITPLLKKIYTVPNQWKLFPDLSCEIYCNELRLTAYSNTVEFHLNKLDCNFNIYVL